MQINLTEQELTIFKKISTAAKNIGVESYVIGGFVRDKILGRATKDIDVVCVGDGIALAEEAAKQFGKNILVNIFKTYGTAQIKIQNNNTSQIKETNINNQSSTFLPTSGEIEGAQEIEFVGARKESYREESRNPIVEIGTLQDDQLRRDFTINAMGISLNEKDFGSLVDPFDGLGDIEKKILKTPLAPTQTFIDDPLRMMRGIRFAAQLQFTLEEKTLQAIADNASRIKIITKERIAEELNKILLCKKPSIGFDLLYKTGLLHIIFPQMVALAGAEFVDGYGHKDNFYHTLQVVDNICETTDDLWLRWAAVLHDIAKPNTKKFEEGHGWTFHGHEAVGARMVPKIFTQLKLPQNEKMRFVQKMVEMHLRPISLTKENITDSAIRRLLFDAGEDIDSLMKLCNADITSKNKQKVKRFLENFEMVRKRCEEVETTDNLRNWQPPITGEIIMETFNLKPSKEVGLIKDAIRNAILDGEVSSDYNAAYAYMLEIGKKMLGTS
jgi:poly(A) polymerase